MGADDKRFVKFWGLYWIAVVVLVFGLFALALTDAVASRRFWMAQFRSLRDDHQSKLRRDLAVHRTQAIVRGRKRLGRRNGTEDADEPADE